MVHETTEYRRKFRWNSSQKRYQIWKENRNFREARRLLEFHHEPFPWEESDHSCHSSSVDDAEYANLPPSKLKQKHLDLIRITEAAKPQTENKVPSVESSLPSPKIHSPLPERETRDVGVQTPNWELLEDEKELFLQSENLKEKELQEVSRRLKEEIAHSHGTLNLVHHIIERGKENYSARPATIGEEKLLVPPLKKPGTVAGSRSLSPDKKQRFFRSKSPFNLHGRQAKVSDTLDKHTFDVKVTKNALQSSAPKFHRKNMSDNILFQRQINPKVERRPYRREGHRVINELRKCGEDAASKWLSDYDNKCRFGVRSAPVNHIRR